MDAVTYLDPINAIPLILELSAGDETLGSATGFAVAAGEQKFLVTNYHVLSGCKPGTRHSMLDSRLVPSSVAVWFHVKDRLGTWRRTTLKLRDSADAPLWREHPRGPSIDVVALPIAPIDDVVLYDLDMTLAAADLVVLPSEPVSIVGFPYGLVSVGKFPIWKTGHVASDVALDYDGLPVFMIDATTRPGMSGSPVFARRIGVHNSSQGMRIGASALRFMGIYSGRIHSQADVGMVWKPSALQELLA